MTGPEVHNHHFVFTETTPLPEAPAWMRLAGYEETLRDFWAGRVTADGGPVAFGAAQEDAPQAIVEPVHTEDTPPVEEVRSTDLRKELLHQIFDEHIKHGSYPAELEAQGFFRNL